jgi:hypothetical protein
LDDDKAHCRASLSALEATRHSFATNPRDELEANNAGMKEGVKEIDGLIGALGHCTRSNKREKAESH